MKRLAAKQIGDHQAVGLEGAEDLGEHAGDIGHPMEGKRRCHEIEARVSKRKNLRIAGDIGSNAGKCFRQPVDADDLPDLRHRGQAGGQLRQRTGKVDGNRKLAFDGAKTVGKVVDRGLQKEIGSGLRLRQCPPAAGVEKRAVEELGRPCHGRAVMERAAGLVKTLANRWRAASRPSILASPQTMTAMESEASTQHPLSAAHLSSVGGAATGALADLVLPPQCLACQRQVAVQGGLCSVCWSGLQLIERPYCEILGSPFAYYLGAGAVSPGAIADPPPFRRCRAVAAYDDVARQLVHGLKYRDRLDLARYMAGWMGRAGAELLADADMIIPVPLYKWRLWSRRFNQSASLANYVAEAAGRPMSTAALCRIRPTRQQVGLSAAERDRNVRGAFKVPENRRLEVADRSIVLVDDVYTTGATVKAAARTLIRAGAAAVDVLVFARVVHGTN